MHAASNVQHVAGQVTEAVQSKGMPTYADCNCGSRSNSAVHDNRLGASTSLAASLTEAYEEYAACNLQSNTHLLSA